MGISSFDVFDTLLTRIYAAPHDLFLALGFELQALGLIRVSAETFADNRRDAELRVRRLESHGEVVLQEIYDQLGRLLNWSREMLEHAQTLEMDLERKAIRPVPGMRERVRAARQESDRVYFLSDMYLPADFIRELLSCHGFFETGDEVRVSGERHRTKVSGRLFEEIRSELPAPITHWRHLGDSEAADFLAPRRLGIEAELLSTVRLNRYESLARGSSAITALWRSKLAGAMRLARLENPESERRRQVIWSTASDMVGPLLFGFVAWCLETALERGVRRLYFVARDGQILHQVAQRLIAAWGLPLECRYLYGSRQAWHPASIVHLQSDDLRWILAPAIRPTVRLILSRVGQAPEDHQDLLNAHSFPVDCWETALDQSALDRLAAVLSRDPLRSSIEHYAQVQREYLLRYLDQEEFFDSIPKAIVDIGWHGNLQKSLARALIAAGRKSAAQITGLYFGIVEHQPLPGQTLFGYWPEQVEPSVQLKHQNLAFFEIFTAADHGSVMGYGLEGAKVVPLLSQPNNQNALAWGLTAQQGGLLRFVELAAEVLPRAAFPLPAFRDLSLTLFRQFYTRPDRAEAEAWGSFNFSDQQKGEQGELMAPDEGWLATLVRIYRGKSRWCWWWHEGSLALRSCWPLAVYIALLRFKNRTW